jgi:type II secretory pathway component PulF
VSLTNNIMFGTTLSISEQCFFFKRLSFLITAGVPLLEALHIVREQAATKPQTLLFTQLAVDVSEGQSLSRSLAKRRNNFSHFSISIVRIGEQSGTLSSNLLYLSDELRKKQQLTRSLIGASIYPAIISLATLGITAFLLLFLFPKITPVFMSMHVALPLTTRIVMSASAFLEQRGLVSIALLIFLIVAVAVALQKSTGLHVWFDRFLLKLPFVKGVLMAYNASQISRTLGLLLKSGIKLSESITITAEATHNSVYRKELYALGQAVEQGEKMSDYLQKHGTYFPATLRHLVAVGERSGSLSETLMYIAEGYDAEVAEFTKRLSTLVEPVLMIVRGLMVGFIAISIITPLYGITQGLHA